MEHLGIDVHEVESQICILTETGEVVERRIRTQRERFAAVLGGRPPQGQARMSSRKTRRSRSLQGMRESDGRRAVVGVVSWVGGAWLAS
jgi:hypothetical protein